MAIVPKLTLDPIETLDVSITNFKIILILDKIWTYFIEPSLYFGA